MNNLQKYARNSSLLYQFLSRKGLICSRSIIGTNVSDGGGRFGWEQLYFQRSVASPVTRTWRISRCYATKHGKKNYYRILGVSPKASQGIIKDAYYKLSMQHHPDRHKGSEKKHEVFQEIAEAYSVLGNLESRKQYDRGLIVQGALAPEQARAAHAPRPTGSIYDFDEWTKQHYYEALRRKQRDKKERRDEELEKESHKIQEGSQRLVILLVFLVIVIVISATERHVLREKFAKQGFKDVRLEGDKNQH